MVNQMKFKIYFKELCNCDKRLLRRIRTQNNTSKLTQTGEIIFGKPDLLFIDGQIQQCKEYVYPVMIKNLLEIVLFGNSLLMKAWIVIGTRRRLFSLRFLNPKKKSFAFINHERSVEELISEHISRIFTKRAIH